MNVQGPLDLDAVHPDDRIHAASSPAHYRYVGQSFLAVSAAAIALRDLTAGPAAIARILDFGCGYGRVTRAMRARWPAAEIVASDIDDQGVAFCAKSFACTPHRSSTDLRVVAFEGKFDLIWLGSVITHLDAGRTAFLLERLAGILSPHGLLLASSHGRRSLDRLIGKLAGPELDFSWYGLSRPRALELLHAHATTGYGYVDYEGQEGYGVSLVQPEWLMRSVSGFAGCRVNAYMEAAWDQHHDVLALQRTPVLHHHPI